MRIALVNIFQISNTFNRRLCGREQFVVSPEIDMGADPLRQFGDADLIKSMIQASRDVNATIVPIFSAVSPTAGRVTSAALDDLRASLKSRLVARSGAFDALVVILSGAMVSETWESADEGILRAARDAVGNELPLLAIWSSQANLSHSMLEIADVNLGFDRTNPVRIEQSARKAIALAMKLHQGSGRPVHELRKLPLLVPLDSQRSSVDPLRPIRALADEFEQASGVLDVSIVPGFPYADTEAAGCSVLVTVEDDRDQASNLANRLRSAIWSSRDAFHSVLPNVETVVHEAMLNDRGSMLIADAGDDPGAGATGEGTGMLWALIDLGAPAATLALIVDPAAVDAGIRAGVGRTITFDLGGAFDRRAGYPIEVKARVLRISDGRVSLGSGEALDLGRTIVFEVEGRHGGQVDVIVSERAVEPSDPEIFRALGIDLDRKKIIAVKSSWRFRSSFAAEASQMVATTTPGITTPVFAYFDFQRIPRPIFPLDPF